MGFFEFLMLCCFGFSWPFSIAKSVRSRSTQGKSLLFMILIELGYIFGIVHKVINNFNWVTYVYAILFCVVMIDIVLYFRNLRIEKREGRRL